MLTVEHTGRDLVSNAKLLVYVHTRHVWSVLFTLWVCFPLVWI